MIESKSKSLVQNSKQQRKPNMRKAARQALRNPWLQYALAVNVARIEFYGRGKKR